MGALSALSGNSALSGLMPGVPPMQIHNTITIDWSGTATPVNRKLYAVNLYQSLNPATTSTQGYKDTIDYIDAPECRIHSLEMTRDSTQRPLGWVKNPTLASYEWDAAKITAALTGLAPGRSKILSICRFPAAIADLQGKLLPGKTAEFAEFCVQLLNIALAANPEIIKVQLLNELDTAYNGAAGMAVLGAIWNECRDAIKAAHPTLSIGGHAFANVWNAVNVDSYLAVCKSKMDWFAYNAYTTSNPAATTIQQIFNSAVNSMPDSVRHVKARLTSAGVGSMPIYATEMGMLVLNSANPLNVGSDRLIWEGLKLIKMPNSGAAFVGAWNESDGWHGLTDSPASGYTKRPAAHLYHLFNKHMIGAFFPITLAGATVPVVNSTPVQCVQAMATQQNGKRAIALVNRSKLQRNVRVQHNGWSPNDGTVLDVNLITGNGIQTAAIPYEDFASGYTMPIDSVAIISVN